jgi:hypothetical protein
MELNLELVAVNGILVAKHTFTWHLPRILLNIVMLVEEKQ